MWYETTGTSTYDGRRAVWVMHKCSHVVCKPVWRCNHQWANSTVARQAERQCSPVRE
jgi:hypothetical protein